MGSVRLGSLSSLTTLESLVPAPRSGILRGSSLWELVDGTVGGLTPRGTVRGTVGGLVVCGTD